jgi:hypothetical protein
MIKTILVPFTGDEADLAAFGAASSVAREFQAHLDVLHVRVDAIDVALVAASVSGGSVRGQGLIEQLEREVHERETTAKRLFDELCIRERLILANAPAEETLQTPTAQWRLETGDEARSLAAHGMTVDLIVAGRSSTHNVTMRSVLETALLDTGRPLLIPGPAAGLSLVGGSIAIA